jgi:hypothetical protein
MKLIIAIFLASATLHQSTDAIRSHAARQALRPNARQNPAKQKDRKPKNTTGD